MLNNTKQLLQSTRGRIASLIILIIFLSLVAWPIVSALQPARNTLCMFDQTALSLDADLRADAGCIVLRKNANNENELLTIISPLNRASIPGGQNRLAESASCTAIRETYEETGIAVTPVKLATVWENGFHIFECQIKPDAKDIATSPSGMHPLVSLIEVSEIHWLSPREFDLYQWRFPEQSVWLSQYIQRGATHDR